jgi:hypothetical protein
MQSATSATAGTENANALRGTSMRRMMARGAAQQARPPARGAQQRRTRAVQPAADAGAVVMSVQPQGEEPDRAGETSAIPAGGTATSFISAGSRASAIRLGQRGSRRAAPRRRASAACADERGDQDHRVGTAEQRMDVLGVGIVLGRLGEARAEDAEDDEAAQHPGDRAPARGPPALSRRAVAGAPPAHLASDPGSRRRWAEFHRVARTSPSHNDHATPADRASASAFSCARLGSG